MLKEKLPTVQNTIDIQNVIFDDIKSSVVANKLPNTSDLLVFLDTRKLMTTQCATEAMRMIADRTFSPIYLVQKQKDMLLNFIDTQSVNLNFLDYNVNVGLDKTYSTIVDVFCQHKTTGKYFLFTFTFFDMFSFTGQFYGSINNTEVNATTLELNLARQAIKTNAGLDVPNLAIINFSTTGTTFGVTKCQLIDDSVLTRYIADKEVPSVTVADPILTSSQSNTQNDIFGSNF